MLKDEYKGWINTSETIEGEYTIVAKATWTRCKPGVRPSFVVVEGDTLQECEQKAHKRIDDILALENIYI